MRRPEYLKFVDLPALPGRKTRVVQVSSAHSGVKLGEILWYGPWRQYVFAPSAQTVFNHGCLDELRATCRRMTEDHREQVRLRR